MKHGALFVPRMRLLVNDASARCLHTITRHLKQVLLHTSHTQIILKKKPDITLKEDNVEGAKTASPRPALDKRQLIILTDIYYLKVSK